MIAEQITAALHELDRFHIMRNMNMANDEVLWANVSHLRQAGYEPMRAMRSRLPPTKIVAKSLRRDRLRIINLFRAKVCAHHKQS